MTWILVIILGNAATTVKGFETEALCKKAAIKVENDQPGLSSIRTTCLEVQK